MLVVPLDSIVYDSGGLQVSPSEQSKSVLHGLLLGDQEPRGAPVVKIKLRSCAHIKLNNIVNVVIINFIVQIYTKTLTFPSDEDQLIVTGLLSYFMVI